MHQWEESMRKFMALVAAMVVAGATFANAETSEIRIPRGAGGIGFLPLLVMEKNGLIEKNAKAAGLDLTVDWLNIGGPAVANDALLSGNADVIAAGPPAFLVLWDKTRSNAGVKGMAAMSSMPMYLNTRADHIQSLKDITASDKIAINALKVSAPAIFMQIYARQELGEAETFSFDRFAVPMSHADGAVAMLSGGTEVTTHFTSPPFHQRERSDPAVRTILTSDEIMGGPSTFTMLSTTTRFYEENPDAYSAILSALEEAVTFIRDNREEAARIYVEFPGNAGNSAEEIKAILDDPDVQYGLTPSNMVKFASFMAQIGTLKNQPDSWKDLFFANIHELDGQ
jgi:NitT/TauT family transport system substrate-binding protein